MLKGNSLIDTLLGLDPEYKFLMGVVALVILYGLQHLARALWKWAWPHIKELVGNHLRLRRAREAIATDSRGIWLTIPARAPKGYRRWLRNSIPIILVANLKGGVGKTTLTAYLAAYFATRDDGASRQARRVLVIDLDFQGSLSSMMFPDNPWVTDASSRASRAIGGQQSAGEFFAGAQPVVQVPNALGISSAYDLARAENRVMIRWLIKDEAGDVRYYLAELLHSDEIQDNFDIVLIDAPPRLTTACIQGLCSATHVLIPTILDHLSTDAVGFFGLQLKDHQSLWPHLKVLGVVGSMMSANRAGQTTQLQAAGDKLRAALEGAAKPIRALEDLGHVLEFPYDSSVPERAALSHSAGTGIDYSAHRGIFDPVGEEIERRLSSCKPTSSTRS